MNTPATLASSASPPSDEPKPSAWWRGRWWRVAGAVVVGVMVVLAMVLVVARRIPEFYRQRTAATAMGSVVADREQAARRLVSDVSALHGAFVREGAWEAAFTEDDLNAWLAIDLPRNHRRLLPELLSEPRVRLSARQVEAGVRVGRGVFSFVPAVTVEVELRDPNQLGITIVEARVGSLRLPHGFVLGEIRRRFDRLGMVTSVRRLDGRSVLVVYIPSTHESGGMSHWLESLSIADGTIAFSGHTRAGRPPTLSPPAMP